MPPAPSRDAEPPNEVVAPQGSSAGRNRSRSPLHFTASSRFRRDFFTAHLPAGAWMVAMTVALAVPSDTADLPAWWPRILHFQALDKVIHFLLFAVAAALLVRSFRRLPGLPRPVLLAFLAVAAYGGVTEVGQEVLTDRRGELGDVVANVVGAGFGVAMMAAARAWRAWRAGRAVDSAERGA